MLEFDFSAAAELFIQHGTNRRPRLEYRRFSTGAEAVRFAVEDADAAAGVTLESDEARYDHRAIQSLYDNPGFPLVRAHSKT